MQSKDYSDVNEFDLKFPPEILKAIQEIIPSDDPFDSPDFNTIDYINEKFPAEQSLHHVDDVLDQMKLNISSIDEEIRTVVRSLSNVEQDGRTSLINAQDSICELFARFVDIKERASESEMRVKEITRDIKQLDTAKRNITTSITTLNHLQMLVEGVDKLSSLKINREYGEIAKLMQGVKEVMDHLARYTHISQVANLAAQVEQIQKDLERQILDDFHTALHGPNSKRYVASKELAEACLVASVLDHRVKKAIIEDMIKSQLAEYEVLFAGGESDAWLDKVELRRKWFLKTALEFEKTTAALFPPSWQVAARLAYSFCSLTNKQLTQAMNLRRSDIDVSMLIMAHKIMSELEQLLARKYVNFCSARLKSTTTQEDSALPANLDGSPSSQSLSINDLHIAHTHTTQSPFIDAICQCFLPFIPVYLNHVDRHLASLIDKFVSDMKTYKFEMLEAEASNVVPCCGELFTYYKSILVEYLKLGCGANVHHLCDLMQKHLKDFAQRVLRASLPRMGSGGLPNKPKDINMKELTAVLAQVQSRFREGDQTRLTEEDVCRTCCILVSCEYCEEMSKRLKAKLQEKMQLRHQPCDNTALFVDVADMFHSILAESIALLVTHVDALCEVSLSVMPKLNWSPDQTGDQSTYVTGVAHHLATNIPTIRMHLHTSRKYFTRFCDKLATTIINKFIQQIYKCRPINGIGCEQLLLDCHAFKNTLMGIPNVGSKALRDPPATYTRMVTRGMAKAELTLQVVMCDYNSPTELIDKYLRVLPEATMLDFQKVLELRGVKDRAAVLEMFRQKSGVGMSVMEFPTQNPSPTSPSTVVYGVASGGPVEQDTSKIARLERILKSRRLMP